MPKLRGCPCVRAQEEEVLVLDYRHCSLDYLPSDVFSAERTLEELFLDANQIRDLPRELFYCHSLRKLTVSDNDIISIPPAIASLTFLEYLDFSKNGVVDLPENIKQCKNLTIVEASVNPLGKLPEGFTQLLNLTELYLNDTFLDYLPGSFGRLTKLKILEVRENHLKTLPKSLARLTCLERLDIGNNDFTELPDVIGALTNLIELWCDTNQLRALPTCIGELRQLMFLDASKNRIEHVPAEIQGCLSLADLHLSINLIQTLPETLGRLSNLTSLKVDDNRLTSLPFSIGGLVSLSELNISANDLIEIPPSIGLLRLMRTMYADENLLEEIPPELGSCSGLTVLSLRSNNLTYIPDELGRIPQLRVLNLSDNRLSFLPYTLTRLKQIQALWLAENQTKPMVRLQSEVHEETGQRVLTCYLLPQQPHDDRDEMYSDTDSFHPSIWEEELEKRTKIKFDFGAMGEEALSRLKRTPTPYPKEMKHRVQHMRNLALKQSGHMGNGDAVRVQNQEQYARERQERDKARMRQRQGSRETDSLDSKGHRSSTGSLPKGNQVRGRRESEDDGGFTDASESHRRVAKQQANTQELSNQGVTHSNQHQMPSNRQPPSQSYNHDEVISADATYPSSIQPAYQPLPHFMQPKVERSRNSRPKSAGDRQSGNYQDVPRTYEDFIRDLKAKSDKQRAMRGDGRDNVARPHSYGASVHRRTGYESDVGYRSEGVMGYGGDGYRSDTGAFNSHRQSRPGGYSSDWGGGGGSVSGRRHKQTGYVSDNEAYARKKQHRYNSAMLNAPPYPNQTGGNHVMPAYNATNAWNQTSQQTNIKSYTNLRSDEMYEQKPNRSEHAATNPYSKSNSSPSNNLPHSQLPSNALHGSQASDRQSGGVSAREEREGSSDDDRYKAQLYEASVRLQKSPNDSARRRKQRNNAEPMVSNSTEQVLTSSNSRNNSSPMTSSSAMTSSCSGQQVSSSVKPNHTALPSSFITQLDSSPRLQRPKQAHTPSENKTFEQAHNTPNKGHAFDQGHHRLYQSSPINSSLSHAQKYKDNPLASKSLTFPTPQKNTPANHIRSHTLSDITEINTNLQDKYKAESDTNMDVNKVNTNQRSESYKSVYQTPHKNTIDRARNESYTSAYRTPTKHQQNTTHLQPQAQSTPYSRDSRTAIMMNVSTPNYVLPGKSQPNYEKDVAMFKRDVTSQVASSIDSGYVHSHERTTGLSQSSLNSPQGHSAVTLSSTPRQKSSPSSQLHPPVTSLPTLTQLQVQLLKNPGLGFSIAGGQSSKGIHPKSDNGIIVTKVQPEGPASTLLQPGDRILMVNGESFVDFTHTQAVDFLRGTGRVVNLSIQRSS